MRGKWHKLCEIRLKENGILREKASYLVNELDEITRNNKVDYAVGYGGFMYKASSILSSPALKTLESLVFTGFRAFSFFRLKADL